MEITLCDKTVGSVLSSTLSHRRQTFGPHPTLAPQPSPAVVKAPGSHGSGIASSPRPHPRFFVPSPRRPPGVSAKLVRFTGRKEVSIPFQERSLPPGEYLKQTERIVNVTFPDSARIKYLGDSVWQARLMTITFFNFSATPFTDVRVVHDDGVLIIDSTRLILDVTGLPQQFRNIDMHLNLHGELRVFPRVRSELWDFGGWVNIGVAVNLPLPLSLIPDKLLTGVGDQVVERILSAMEGALLQGIIADYNAWCGALPATSPAVPSGQQK